MFGLLKAQLLRKKSLKMPFNTHTLWQQRWLELIIFLLLNCILIVVTTLLTTYFLVCFVEWCRLKFYSGEYPVLFIQEVNPDTHMFQDNLGIVAYILHVCKDGHLWLCNALCYTVCISPS